MKKLSLVFDEAVELDESVKKEPIQKVIWLVIQSIVRIYANSKRGLKEGERKIYYKLNKDFEKALSDKDNLPDFIELEDETIGFIRMCKREALLMPDKILEKVEELIDKCQLIN